MYIEDLILSISFFNTIPCDLNRFDKPIMTSIADQCIKGVGLTNKQVALVMKILSKYSPQLANSIPNVQAILQSPTFRLAIREVNSATRISIIDCSKLGKTIKLEFPYSEEKVAYIRQNRSTIGDPHWDDTQRAWIFPLSEISLVFLLSFINFDSTKYDIDPVLNDLLDQTRNIINAAEQHAPMLTVKNGVPTYVNTSAFIPPLVSDNIVEAMFEARLSGITLWDDSVSPYLETANINQVTKTLLLSDNSGKYTKVNSDTTPIDDLAEVIKFLKKVLFIVPEHIALPTIEKVHEFLKRTGYSSEEMSVMFRLPTSTNSKFNDYVKSNNMNSPITAKTRFVFVSVKMPKPVLSSDFRANCVINFGESNAHYTMREFIKNSQNLIYFCP